MRILEKSENDKKYRRKDFCIEKFLRSVNLTPYLKYDKFIQMKAFYG